jgi:riboflavin biosynthesis pyrimidine reductase
VPGESEPAWVIRATPQSHMDKAILRLYPLPSQEVQLKGLYLGDNLRQYAHALDRAFVYSNFITSLDGRIAIAHPTKPGMVVPDQIANPRDWRLFQELAVQADVLITSGRYLRDYVDGRAQEILRVYDDPQLTDLKGWRNKNGLKPLPDLAVISGSLDFPIPEVLAQSDRSILVYTTSKADPQRRETMEAQMGRVIVAGEESVEGQYLITSLSDLGYRMVYSATGPRVLHLLLAAGMLDRLYLTRTNRMLGGDPFSSIVEGRFLDPPVDFELVSAHYDPHALDGLGQLLSAYQRANYPK